jgi:hypothetical protein
MVLRLLVLEIYNSIYLSTFQYFQPQNQRIEGELAEGGNGRRHGKRGIRKGCEKEDWQKEELQKA